MKTPHGFPLRLRCGTAQRQRFYLQCRRECDFEQRAARMQTMAKQLVDSGRSSEAVKVLKLAAEQPTEALFSRVEKRCQELCSSALTPTGPAPLARTFRDLGELWTSGALTKRYPHRVGPLAETTGAKHVQRLNRLYQWVGSVPLSGFTVEHADHAMEKLSPKIKGRTRVQYAMLIARVLKLAAQPCRLIERSPIESGWVPRPSASPALSFLYPTEDQRLLACPDVPLGMRLLYGFLCREGMRSGEAMRLEWGHLDLSRGVVRLDKNKTDRPRAWKLEPGTAHALTEWQKQSEGTLVFPRLEKKAAETFREHLQTAGVDRAELFERSPERQPIRVHDCRGTFVTHSLANGKTEQWVMDRTGHTTSNQLHGYHRQARFAEELELGPLAPLDQALGLGKGPGLVRPKVGQRVGQDRQTSMVSAGQERIEDAVPDVQVHASAEKTRASRTGKPRKLPHGPAANGGVGQNEDLNSKETDMSDDVETILARALDRASKAGEWETVKSLAAELTERRRAKAGVVSIDAARKRGPR